MRARIETISHSEQRYDTCGDWWWTKDDLEIRVSRLGNADYEFLVALHELVEAYLCRAARVSEEAVTRFDRAWNADPSKYPFSEPGDDPGAPYRLQHRAATMVELLVAHVLEVEWRDYENAIEEVE